MKYIFLFLTMTSAHAQECPSIAGNFRCLNDQKQPYQIQVQIQDSDFGTALYTFSGPAEGATELIADGQERPIKNTLGSGTFRGVCERGRLIVYFTLTDPSGQPLQYRDEMYMERGGLVRIRFQQRQADRDKGDIVTSSSCKPVFERPRP